MSARLTHMQKHFDGSRLKIKRARHHMGDLMNEIRAFLLREPFYLEIVAGSAPGTKNWIVHVREEVPADFSAILGDAIHNLRAALDLLACELVRLNGKSDDNVAFPFSKSAATYGNALTERNMSRASLAALALMKTLQPYHGGNEQLRAIHDLDIMDKHIMLIPATDMVAMPDYLGGTALRLGARVGPIRDGLSVAAPADIAPYLRISGQSRGVFSLHFPVGPLDGREIIPELIRLATLVENIVEQFARLYP